MKKLILFTFLTASLVPVRAQTAIVYVPSGAQSQPGNAVLVPYQWEYQQLFDASLFSSLPPGGGVIRGLSLRPSVRSPSKEAELSGIIIELSTTMKTIGSLSPIFAENTGSDNQVYWSGRSVRWISGGVEDGTPQRWSPGFGVLPGEGFSYDPTKGNLLMRIRNLQLPDVILVLGYDAVRDSPFTASVIGEAGALRGTVRSEALVVGFGFTDLVPEPSPAMLLALGSAVLLGLSSQIAGRKESDVVS